MVNQAAVAAFYLLVLAILSNFQLSASSLVCGKVSCLDCHRDFDFSDSVIHTRRSVSTVRPGTDQIFGQF
ncbi:hypothetical protein F2Q69_00044313 [Brassica cretica]|uniref:Secreted protein n=1 Tax=Brassica cretica TaxID=69181 RepID=A0A8S9NRG1_BRACR|nr:hypothetical protein F2Q69_00044313 [Brassica cretica]